MRMTPWCVIPFTVLSEGLLSAVSVGPCGVKFDGRIRNACVPFCLCLALHAIAPSEYGQWGLAPQHKTLRRLRFLPLEQDAPTTKATSRVRIKVGRAERGAPLQHVLERLLDAANGRPFARRPPASGDANADGIEAFVSPHGLAAEGRTWVSGAP